MSVTEMDRLIISIEANTSRINSQLAQLQGQVDGSMGAVENRVSGMRDKLTSHFGSVERLTRNLTAGFAAMSAVRFGENVIADFDKIAEKARSFGTNVPIELLESMKNLRDGWSKIWNQMQVNAATVLDVVGSKVLQGIQIQQRAQEQLSQSVENAIAGGGVDLKLQPGKVFFQIDPKIITEIQNNQLDAASKLANAQDSLNAKLKLQVELAGETVDQRKIDQQIIEAATKQLEIQNQAASTFISSVAQARSIVGAGVAGQISGAAVQENAAGVQQALSQRLLNAGSGTQPAALANVDKAGILAGVNQSIERLEAANRLATTRQALENQFINDLQTEANIAGLMPKQLEEEVTLMRARDRFGEDFAKGNEETIRSLVQQRQQMQEFADLHQRMTQNFQDFLASVERGTGSFRKLFQSILFSWEDMLNKMISEQIFKQLFSAGAGALFGGGGIGSLFGSLLGGGKAGGGDVYPGNVYPVGERGPELFAPAVPGRIIPNGAAAAGGSAYFDLRGAVVTQDLLDQMNSISQRNSSAAMAQAVRQSDARFATNYDRTLRDLR